MGDKLYQQLMDRPVLAHTLGRLQDADFIEEIVLVIRAEDRERCRDEILKPFALNKVTGILSGGATRQESVYLGLKFMGRSGDCVAVHDGARPLVSLDLIGRVIEAGLESGAAVPGIPVKDTLKQVSGRTVAGGVDRTGLVQVQTPQVFWRELLWMAHSRAREDGITATDDAGLVERARHPVLVVAGEEENIKLTTAFDFLVATAILEQRARGGR
jgi:2-C-methyl-D-erythritol 4-phosphate cytidylyltransferase